MQEGESLQYFKTSVILTCMSRRVMKPLLSMSHIWKNSWVFSTIVFCPTSPFSLLSTSSLPPCLCHAVRATVVVVALLVAQGAGKAAMVSVSLLIWVRPSHEPRYRQRCGEKRWWRSRASGCSTSEAPTNVTDCHLLATASLISRWNLGGRQERESSVWALITK